LEADFLGDMRKEANLLTVVERSRSGAILQLGRQLSAYTHGGEKSPVLNCQERDRLAAVVDRLRLSDCVREAVGET